MIIKAVLGTSYRFWVMPADEKWFGFANKSRIFQSSNGNDYSHGKTD